MPRFLLPLFLISSLLATSQNEISLAEKANRLTEYLADVHLRPRTMDSLFGADVHALLIDDFDANHLFFTVKDSKELSELAKELGSEITNKTSNYSKAFHDRYVIQREQAEKTVLSLLDRPLNLEKYASIPSDGEDTFAANDTEFKTRWERILIKSIIEKLLDEYDEEHAPTINDLRKKQSEATAEIKESYQHYFGALKSSDRYFELRFLNCITCAYDPHSSFFDLTLKEEFKDELVADRAIFGISYQRTLSGNWEISGIVPGSSAWFSGEVHVGDQIVQISTTDGRNTHTDSTGIDGLRSFFTELTSDTISMQLLTEDDELKTVQLIRSKVYSDGDVIKTAVLSGDKKVGYISLPDFYTNWTELGELGCANDVAKSLLNLQKENVEGIILDLRDNGGGSLKEAVDLVGIFINYGPVILELEASGEVFTYKDMNRGAITSAPLIVLVNAQSASASELVAGTLQDYNRAVIVGQTTFGKATGQSIFPLDPDVNHSYDAHKKENTEWGYAKATRLGLYRITKQSAQGKGVIPDISLVNLDPYPTDYEKELPHFIQLDSIEKKVYATLAPPLPIEQLNAGYTPTPLSLQLSSLRDSILFLEDQLAASFSLEKSVQLLQIVHRLYSAHDKAIEESTASFTPISKQFNSAQLSVAPYLEKYDDQFKNRLLHDVELNEAYQIMLNFIKLNQ